MHTVGYDPSGHDKGIQENAVPETPAAKVGAGQRLIPGTEGVVTGGDSTKLGKNMMESMGLPRGTKWTGHQAQHIIPAEMADYPVLQRIGMDINQSVDVLQNQVHDLQQNLKCLQQSGLPLYPSQGATVDLWQRSLERIQ